MFDFVLYVLVSFILSYLFYGNLYFGLISIIFIKKFYAYASNIKLKKQKKILTKQFLDMLHHLVNNLRAGFSLENAFFETYKNLKLMYDDDQPIMIKLAKFLGKLKINISVENALNDFAKDCDIEDIYSFVDVFSYSKKMGGNMVKIIKNTENILREKIELETEINGIMAGKKFEFKVMCIIPFAIILYMKFSFPEFMNILYGNVVGIVIMTISLVLIGIAYLIGSKIVDIKV